MAKTVVILQHVPNENAGTILDHLRREKIPFEQVELFKGARPPELSSARALVVMGGPMNVYEEAENPFLKEENAYIQEAVRRKVPYLGVCLGSQLLAKALGARVYKAKAEEIGWQDVDLSPASRQDPVFSALEGGPLKVLQWHGDTFDLPAGAVHLASNPVVPNQAYAVDGRYYGLQFHVEVNRPMLEDWFGKRADLARILAEYDQYQQDLSKIVNKLYENFFKLT